MTLLMLLFWLLVGGTLQGVMPAWQHMGQPAFPILLGVVIYAATNKKTGYFLLAALIAGVLEDSLSLVPLGSSVLAFLVAGWLALRLRTHFFADKASHAAWFGALCAAVATGAMALLLRGQGLLALPPRDVLWRMAGSALLGLVVMPVLFALMRGLERRLGTWEGA